MENVQKRVEGESRLIQEKCSQRSLVEIFVNFRLLVRLARFNATQTSAQVLTGFVTALQSIEI